MATGTVRISDVVVPEVFGPYMQQLSEEKSSLIQSGAVARDSALDQKLSGGGLTFNEPSFKDVDNEDENVSSDDPAVFSAAKKIGKAQEIQVRLSRNQSWSGMDLAADLAGADPMEAIAIRVANYWNLRRQALFVATMKGVFADNDAAASGTDTHTQFDLRVDISAGAFADGVTNFSTEAFIDACTTMGDSQGGLAMIMVHSVVYARMQKNNLIDFIPDARSEVDIPTFLGKRVVVDDGMPNTAGVFENWIFGPGALRMGEGAPQVPVETIRVPSAGNGGGQDTLHSRVEWCLHPVGHAWIGSLSGAPGGPGNGTGSNQLANAASWSRVFPQRKQIKVARLVTREF